MPSAIYLEQLLSSLLSRKVVTFERIKQLVSSIGQDIIYNATHGENKTQKHMVSSAVEAEDWFQTND